MKHFPKTQVRIPDEELGAWAGHRLGIVFADESLLRSAVTHPSFAEENPGYGPDYQRLEFLGDAVVGAVIARALYDAYPEAAEGELSKHRARLVSTRTHAELARELGLGEALRLGRGEALTQGRDKRRVLADVFEAIAGAAMLDGGMPAAQAFIRSAFGDRVTAVREHIVDFKTALQEWAQARSMERPTYTTDEVTGPGHEQTFHVTVWLDDRPLGGGTGASKKRAQQAAARAALEALTPTADDTMQSHGLRSEPEPNAE